MATIVQLLFPAALKGNEPPVKVTRSKRKSAIPPQDEEVIPVTVVSAGIISVSVSPVKLELVVGLVRVMVRLLVPLTKGLFGENALATLICLCWTARGAVAGLALETPCVELIAPMGIVLV